MTGILAVQGDFAEHEKMLRSLGEECIELRDKADALRPFDRLILPGGESTVQSKLLAELDMLNVLKERIEGGTPVLATCAGLILLAERSDGKDGCAFRTLPVNVKRNAYGRQLGSFYTEGDFSDLGRVPMEFIRAPYIESAANEVDIMSVTDGHITGVRYKNQLAVSFHPELCDNPAIARYFLAM